MKVSNQAIELIKHHEGVKTRPYQDPIYLWTVGVGHVIDPSHIKIPIKERIKLPIPTGWDREFSNQEIDNLLKEDLSRFEKGVLKLCPQCTQNQFDALVSLAFNIGLGNLEISTLRTKHNNQYFKGAAMEFLKWNKANGKVLNGLTKRREAEKKLYEQSIEKNY